jgi:tetratricopeptide (TPR) repeat protein
MPIMTTQESDALHTAIKLHQAGRYPEAEVAYRRALAFNANNVEALHMLGVLLFQAGHPAPGAELIDRAVALMPTHTDAFTNLAEVRRTLGHNEQALAAIDRALALNPRSAPAHTNRAAILRQADRHEEALAAARTAIALDPAQALAYVHAGCVLIRSSPADAIAHFEKAIQLDPRNADTISSMGVCYEMLGEHENNLACQQRAIALAPQSLLIARNLGAALANIGHYVEAAHIFEQVLAHQPDDLHALLNYAGCQQRLRNYEKVVEIANRVLEKYPDSPEPYSLLADAHGIVGDFDKALDAVDRGLALQPLPRLHHSKGIALIRSGRAPEGLDALEQALVLDPTNAILHFDISVARLLNGKLAEAWPEYEWRWKHPGLRSHAVSFKQPQWDGSPLNGKRILLYAEQGLGDTVFFGRYATRVAEEKGGHVILVVQPGLVDLMKSVRGVQQVITNGVPLPTFDTHLPIMSLPGIFHTTLENIPHDVPYIAADRARVEHWKTRLTSSRHPFRVGLVWEGGAFQTENFLRSASLHAFSPLASIPGISFFSLQKGPAAEQARPANLPTAWRSPDADFTDLDADIHDFSDTAAILQNLDLLVSIDTSVVHVAGALAKPVWMLLAHAPGHMWLLHRTDSPWYPTFRLFRQPAFKDWATPVDEIARLLREKVRA